MNEKEKLAYTAGLIDGEGYLGLIKVPAKFPCYSPVVKLASCDPYMVPFMHTNYGGYIENRNPQNQNHNLSTAWSIKNSKQVKAFLIQIEPYLIVKKEQSRVLLSYIENCMERKLIRDSQTGLYTMESSMRAAREAHYASIRKLNSRGRAVAETE